MTMFRFGPLLAIGGAACLIAWTPEGRPPPNPEIAAPPASGARVDDAPTETASIPRLALAGRPSPGDEPAAPASIPAPSPKAALNGADLAALSEQAQERLVGLKAPPLAISAESADVPASPPEAAASEAAAKVQLAYADIEGAAPAPWRALPDRGASAKRSGPGAACALNGPEPSAPAAEPALPSISPPVSQAAILYHEGRRSGARCARRLGQ